MTNYAVWQNSQIVQRLSDGVGFTLSGAKFPANWLTNASAADKAAYNIYPIVYSNLQGDGRYFANTESAPTFSGGQVIMAWIASAFPLPIILGAKQSDLKTAASLALGSGLTVSGRRYATDPVSLQVARSAIQDVINGATLTSYMQDTSGAMTVITSGNVNAARNALAKFFYNVCDYQNGLNGQMTALSASGNASGLVSLNTNSGWPTS